MNTTRKAPRMEHVSVRFPEEVVARLDSIAVQLSTPGNPLNRSDAVRIAVAKGLDVLVPLTVAPGERCGYPVADEQMRAKLCGKPATAVRIVYGVDMTYCAEHAAKIDAEPGEKGGA